MGYRAGNERRFSIDGGRAGWGTFVEGDRHARLEWEMLVGEAVMVIYGDRCFWNGSQLCQMTRHEVRAVVVQLATALAAPVELTFTGGDEVIRPQPASERGR